MWFNSDHLAIFRTQNVLGEKGRRIRELTAVVQKRFGFPEGSVEVGNQKIRLKCFKLTVGCILVLNNPSVETYRNKYLKVLSFLGEGENVNILKKFFLKVLFLFFFVFLNINTYDQVFLQ